MNTVNHQTSKIPILFLIFAREDTASLAFEEIRKYQPERLYIAADGPRSSKAGEAEACNLTRKTILDMIDWPCEVFKLFREKNLGCANAVSQAIDWFFEAEEYGVIIEDDVIISQDFLKLCELLLPYHKDDGQIFHISAQNRSFKYQSTNEYVFARVPNVWGWATWRRAWTNMDMKMSKWSSFSKWKSIKTYGLFQGGMMNYYWMMTYKHLNTNQSWATRWWFSIIQNNGICITPKANLAINIGIGNSDATHYKKGEKDPYAYLTLGRIEWPLKIPNHIYCDKEQLKYDRQDFFRIRMIGLKKKLLRLIRRSK